jgi:FkbH-like protein
MLDQSNKGVVQADQAPKIKCLVWDLDQTLWEGRLLEGDEPRLRPGVVGILRELDARGILLSVASTNDHNHVSFYLERFGIADLFVVPEIHLGSKHESVSRIASRLGLQLAHIGFIDDDPLERELVCSFHRAVQVFDAADYDTLLEDQRFTPQVISVDGRRRRELIMANLRRQEAETNDGDLEEFLAACEIVFTARPAEVADLDRLLELTLRTNRMNASGRHYTAEEVTTAITDNATSVLLGSMHDRFGDYGTVAAALLRRHGTVLRAEGLWMSCRVAKRGLAQSFFSALAGFALERGVRTLEIEYSPTEANRLAALHMGLYGFRATERTEGKLYRLSLPDGIRPYPAWVSVTT